MTSFPHDEKRTSVSSLELHPQTWHFKVFTHKKPRAVFALRKIRIYNRAMPGRISLDDTKPEEKPVSDSYPAPLTDSTSSLDQELSSRSHSSFLSAFSAFPQDVHFSGQDSDEKVILLLRAHLATTTVWVAATITALLLPIVTIPVLSALNLTGFGVGAGLVFILFWYLGVFTYSFLNFLYWYFNVYVLSNERVVDVDWYSIIYRRVSSAPLSKIQDVTFVQAGVFAGMFNYGDVHIQTAGEEANFEFLSVPHPQLVVKKTQELMAQQKEHAV